MPSIRYHTRKPIRLSFVVVVIPTSMDLLNLSFFTSARDNQPKAFTASWSDLAEHLKEPRIAACTPETCKRSECTEKHGHAWSPASYPEGSPRARSAVHEVSALVLDIDHVASDEALVEILDKIPYRRIIHGSHSDKPGDRCVRVVVALSTPVPGGQWPTFWSAVIKHLGVPVDQSTKDASRLYFLPSRSTGASTTEFGDGTDYLYATTEGPTLDVADILANAPTSHTPDVGATPTVPHIVSDKQGRERAVEALSQAWPATQRHQASLALAGALAHANWEADQIADFLHDVMDVVYGPGADPSARKRDDQAQSSYAKFRSGEPVQGWPSLIPHVGEQVVAEVTQALNIGGKPGQWITTLIAKHKQTAKPTQDQLVAHLKATRSKLLKQRTNTQSQFDAKLLGKVLDHEQPAEGDEDRTAALVSTIRTLVRWVPDNTENSQVANLLAHVFPINVGQDADRAWADTLTDLVESCIAVMAQEAQEDGEFEMETSGQRLGKPKNTLRNILVGLKKLGVKLKFDLFSHKKLISRNAGPWEVVEDRHIDEVWFEMEDHWDLQFGYEKFARYLTQQAYINAFHPVRDYLDTLEWDGIPRIDTWLHAYGQAENTEYTRAIGRLVLVAAVRRVREPGCKFDEMLILEGEQGVQKSSALRALCPDVTWFTDDMPLHADTKRVIESTGGKWIIEAGELRGMSKADISNLKGFLSRAIDEARMAFGREVRISPRQFIIIGTTNDAQYLHDPTGLRRFWPVAVIMFDLAQLLADRDQLWAEAAHYEAQGESIRLDPKYYALAAEAQEERRVVDNIEAIIEEAFSGHVGRVKCLDLYQLLGKDAVDARPDEQRRVGDAMRRIGWKHTRRRVSGKPTYVYVKGDKEEENVALGVSGRKVVKVQEATGPMPLTPGNSPVKVN